MISCNIDDTEISDKIVAPDNTILPIIGKWLVEDYKLGSISSMDEESRRIAYRQRGAIPRKISSHRG